MKWLCTDCSTTPKRGRRTPCILCCGYNTEEAIANRTRHPLPPGDTDLIPRYIVCAHTACNVLAFDRKYDRDWCEKHLRTAQRQPRTAPAHRALKPCGTHAAFVRHRAKGEHVDLACEVAERVFQRKYKQQQRSQTRQAA